MVEPGQAGFSTSAAPLTMPRFAAQPGQMLIVDDPIELFGAKSLQDPYPLYERMRAAGPVHRIGDSEFYAACSWDALNEAIGRPEDFSSNLTATMIYTAEGIVAPFTMAPFGDP